MNQAYPYFVEKAIHDGDLVTCPNGHEFTARVFVDSFETHCPTCGNGMNVYPEDV